MHRYIQVGFLRFLLDNHVIIGEKIYSFNLIKSVQISINVQIHRTMTFVDMSNNIDCINKHGQTNRLAELLTFRALVLDCPSDPF